MARIDQVVRDVWDYCMNKRFSDTMRKAREDALIHAKPANLNVPPDGDLTFLKLYYPN